jgi:hypothetical protein
LYSNTVEESGPPLWNSEHDSPSGSSDGFLSSQSGFDLVEFSLDPFFVGAVKVELLKHLHSLLFSICLHQVTRAFGEEYDADEKEGSRNGLESEWKAPGKA